MSPNNITQKAIEFYKKLLIHVSLFLQQFHRVVKLTCSPLYLQRCQIYNIKTFHTSQPSDYLGVLFLQTELSYYFLIWSFSNWNNFPYFSFILQCCPKIDLMTLFLFYPINTFFHILLGRFLSLPPTFADTSFGTVHFQFGFYAYMCMCMCLCMCARVCAYFDYLCIILSIETFFEAQLPTYCRFFCLVWIWFYWEAVSFFECKMNVLEN